MPSREFRRAMRRKEEEKPNVVEKRRERHPVIYALSVVILVVIVVTFIGTPTVRGRLRGAGNKIEFGTFKGKPVEYYASNYFAERVSAVNEQLRGSNQNPEDLESVAYQVWRTAFDQTVVHMAFLAEAESARAWISEDRVDEVLIQSGPWSQGGVFDEERYRATSNADKYAYRKLFREQLLDEQVQRDLLADERYSQKEVDLFKSMISSQRKFSFVSFAFRDFPDAEVRAYGEKNADRFRRIKLSQILVKSSENEAREIRSKLEDRSASFEELARAHSKDAYAEKGGDAGWRYFYDLESEFEQKEPLETVMGLAEGALSGVLRSRYGWVIYRCDSPALRPDFADAETLQAVRGYLMRYEKGLVEDFMLKRAEAFRERARDIGFLGAALAQNLKTQATEYFPLNYQGVYFLAPVRAAGQDADISSAGSNEEFFLKAFRLAPGEVSEPVLLDDQAIVLRLEDVRQAPQEQLDLDAEYLSYFGRQALQGDLQATLLKPEYLKDYFHDTFYTYIFAPQPTQSQ
jgi:parvulin-like peptidyl-prolyl isomerase